MVVFPILSFLFSGWMMGWASAPYDPRWAVANPRKSALVSLAGPASNFLLVLLAALAIRGGMLAGWFAAPERVEFTRVTDPLSPNAVFFASMLSITFSLNLILCVFNLLPLPPLDGSGALMGFLPPDKAEKYLTLLGQSGVGMFGLLVAWKVFSPIFGPIHLFVINLLYPGVHYG